MRVTEVGPVSLNANISAAACSNDQERLAISIFFIKCLPDCLIVQGGEGGRLSTILTPPVHHMKDTHCMRFV